MKNIKFAPTLPFAIAYFLLLVLIILLFLGRTIPFLRIATLSKWFPDFYFHVSNFSISYLIYAGVGFMWLMLGLKFKLVMGFGILILMVNFIYELWISILNTPDLIDAYYGFLGTLGAFLFLFLTKKYGLQANPISRA